MTREEVIEILEYIHDLLHEERYKEFEESDVPALRMAIAALREQPRWISVEERLPDLELVAVRTNSKDLIPCLAVIKNQLAENGRFVGKVWYDGDGFMSVLGEPEVVTYWMPLPEPPKEDMND